jgi:hypothetical protein
VGLIDEKNRGSKISCYCPFKRKIRPQMKNICCSCKVVFCGGNSGWVGNTDVCYNWVSFEDKWREILINKQEPRSGTVSVVSVFHIAQKYGKYKKVKDHKENMVYGYGRSWYSQCLLYIAANDLCERFNATSIGSQGPHLRTLNPGFNPGFTAYICYIKGGWTLG